MADLRNEFSWSLSRHQALKACARRYYFKHYKHWGGWDADAPAEVREVYRLGKLESRVTWQSSVVRRVIARAIQAARRGRPVPDPEAAVQEAIGWMRQDYRDSREDLARRTGNVKMHVRFAEHETGADDGSPAWRARWKESADTVASCLRGFFESDQYARLLALAPGGWIETEDPAARVAPSFDYRGVKVHARVACAIREAGRPVAIDWKVSRRELPPLPTQLAALALYLEQRHGVPPADLRVREIGLLSGRVQEHAVGAEALEVFREVFEESVELMRGLLADPDANVPRPEGAFALTEDERECRFCNYRSICPKVAAAF